MYGDTQSMKIFGTNTDSVKTTQEKKTKTAKSESPQNINAGSSFIEILESIVPSDKEDTREINELWQKLPDSEKRFLKEPNNENLNQYKMLVKDIINAIMKSNTMLVQARQRGKNDKKILMSVKIIDDNIQLLAMTMLSPNNSAFNLLKQIEKIRGLLMDLKQ
jgi:uncharacterized protein YaaR (DUF327 family)